MNTSAIARRAGEAGVSQRIFRAEYEAISEYQMPISNHVIAGYVHMWPREVFDFRQGRQTLGSLRHALQRKPGVYVLYRDDHPYYIGKAKGVRMTGSLYSRLRDHATKITDRYYNFWNFFSAFIVPERKYIDEIEGVLIASIGITANSARPKIRRIPLPSDLARLIKLQRHLTIESADSDL